MLSVAFPYCYAELYYAECRMLSAFMLNVVMVSVVVPKLDLLVILLRWVKGAIGRQQALLKANNTTNYIKKAVQNIWLYDTQHNNIQLQHNDTQHNEIQFNNK